MKYKIQMAIDITQKNANKACKKTGSRGLGILGTQIFSFDFCKGIYTL